MSSYAVDPDALDEIVRYMTADAPESDAFRENIDQMEGAIGAFSTDEDNQKYQQTLGQIKSQHIQIEAMFLNVLQRLTTVSRNYREADHSALVE